ncbi:glutamate 5-kinase [Demequina sp. SYSU T00039]|uniref:Glutamate 5-kinase n=1 Tax=Demequina lignilytica TaxID=3051663 RepID=A0AAW7LZU9_9MICO|nr:MULTISPECIES: glutamate 5-kinase [unclassified Demequina]MDN4478370.1 glutamate 5-kinase [Demequina sp. SYSU T00039-1]MDN4487123.1 glutamate 5-kinase [Demequina sp. SYSU T00039]MDN4489834.1 glutamate 5-kinase [Demequina sp. SYSU T00068]
MSEARASVAQARRIVVKVGSSSLTGSDGTLDEVRLGALVDALGDIRTQGREVLLVTSGSIAAGIGPLGLEARPTNLELQQAAASVGQGKLIHAYTVAFARYGLTVGQVLLTADDMVRRAHYGNARRALESLLGLGVVPIINENDTVATDEIRFGDNDRLAALVATAVRADALVLLTDVDALYTAAPDSPGARRIAEVRSPEDLQGIDISRRGSAVGTGGMITKIEAASLATNSGVTAVLAAATDAARAVAGDDVGTVFLPTGKAETTRLQWLADAAKTRGGIVLDSGAVRALRGRQASLLAAGVVEIRGDFEAGEPVDLLGPDGALVARGFAGFSSEEADRMKGLSTEALGEVLGDAYARELIHIDHLVVL